MGSGTGRALGSGPSTGRLPGLLPAPGPGLQLGHRRAEVGALLGQRVADPDRGAGVDLATDDAGLLELSQALGEQPVREAGDDLAELAEAQRSLAEGGDDRPGPALAKQLDCGVEVRADSRGLSAGGRCPHGGSSLLNVSDGPFA